MSSKQKTRNSFIINGTILAAAGIMVRLIGLIYRIPLNNILGSGGNGLYSNAYSIYNILLLISSVSLPLAISKIVSAKVTARKYEDCVKVLKVSFAFALIVGGSIAIITFIFADFIADIAGYPSCAPALRVLAPTVLVVCIAGVIRGYFQGLNTMIPTAVSQIFEQIINAIISIIAAKKLSEIGIHIASKYGKGNMKDAYGAAGGTLGTCLGAVTALLILLIYYYVNKRDITFEDRIIQDDFYDDDYREILKLFFVTVIPVLLSTTLYQLSNVLDGMIFGNILRSKGLTEDDYKAVWGVYSGNYVLITNIPVAIAAALSTSLVPSLISSYTKGDRREVADKISILLKFTLIIALPSGVGLMVLGKPIIAMLFRTTILRIAYKLMLFSFLTVVFYSLSTITNGILQGVDKLNVPLKHSAISFAIHIVLLPISLNFVKKSNFEMAIYIIVIFDLLYSIVLCILNAIAIRRYTIYRFEWLSSFIRPFMCSLVMGLLSYGSYKGLKSIIPFRYACIIAMFVAVVTYAITLVLFKAITKEELLNMPKGNKIYRIFKKVHLMN